MDKSRANRDTNRDILLAHRLSLWNRQKQIIVSWDQLLHMNPKEEEHGCIAR